MYRISKITNKSFTIMVARTLKLNEIVYIVFEDGVQLAKGRITAVDFKQRDFHFSGDELNIDVEVEITETLSKPTDYRAGEHIHVNNQEIYQIVPDKHFLGEEVCYEIEPDLYNDYYCPVMNSSFDENGFDESRTANGTRYTKEEMLAMCENFGNGDVDEMASEYADDYDYDSDTLDAREAVHDAVVYGIQWALEHLKELEA